MRSRCQQAALFPESLGESPFLAFQLLGAVSVPRLVAASLPASSSYHLLWVSLKAPSGGFPGGFPGGTVVKNPPANAGDMGSSPGPGRSHMPRSN